MGKLYDFSFSVIERCAAGYPTRVIADVCEHSNPWNVGDELRYSVAMTMHCGFAESLYPAEAGEWPDKFIASARRAVLSLEGVTA